MTSLTDNERWGTLTFAQQMGHIASELARARHWEHAGDPHHKNDALTRALTLIDRTIGDSRWQQRLSELARFREVVCGWYANSADFDVNPEELEHYCLTIYLRNN